MGKKGTPHRRYSKEEKMKYVRLHLEKHLSVGQIEQEYESGRSWCKQGIRYWQRKDYEVLKELKVKYPVVSLCKIMGINRSEYYKWKARQGKVNRYEQDRILLTQLLQEEHKLHPSLGYHRLAGNIFYNTGWVFSDNLAHKCCKAAGIRSKARKCKYRSP